MTETESCTDCLDEYMDVLDRSMEADPSMEVETAARLAALLVERGDDQSVMRAHQVLSQVAHVRDWPSTYTATPNTRPGRTPLGAWSRSGPPGAAISSSESEKP